MEYRVEEWPAFQVAGYVTEVTEKDAFKKVPGVWDKAWKDGSVDSLFLLLEKADYRPEGLLGIAEGGPGEKEGEIDYIIGVTTFVDTPGCIYVAPELGMQERSYPAAKWIIVSANGALPDAVQKVYAEFYHDFLPYSGYKMAALPVIEVYRDEERQEIWFPVEE